MVPIEYRQTLEQACQFRDWEGTFSWASPSDQTDLFTCAWDHAGSKIGVLVIEFTDPSVMYVRHLTLEEGYQKQSLFKHLVVTITAWAQESRYLDMKIKIAGPGRKAFELAGYPIDDYGFAEGNIEDTPENRALHPQVASFYDWVKGEVLEEPAWRKAEKLNPPKPIKPIPAPSTPVES